MRRQKNKFKTLFLGNHFFWVLIFFFFISFQKKNKIVWMSDESRRVCNLTHDAASLGI